jgi:serine/threonine-protein kinase
VPAPRPEARSRGALAPGDRVGPWIVDGLHAEGGFAAVYRGRHQHDGRRAALKVLHPELSVSPEARLRFEREAQVLLRLRHPHIVEMYDVQPVAHGGTALIMEWLDGRDLAAELSVRGSFTVAETIAIVDELGSALAAAHERGLVHRDVKAQNVIAQPAGDWFTVKLIDFGIAKITDEAPGAALTTSRQILGTPLTMAPEQILGRPVDRRVDVYALGVLVYQLLTGRLPFYGATSLETEELHLRAPPPRAGDVARVPAAVDAVIARAMAKAPQARFPGPTELLVALRAAGEGSEPRAEAVRAQAHVAALVVEFPGAGVDGTDDTEAATAALADAGEIAECFRKMCRALTAEPVVDLGDVWVVRLADEPDGLDRARARLAALAAEVAGRPDPVVGVAMGVAKVTVDQDGDGRFLPDVEGLRAALGAA